MEKEFFIILSLILWPTPLLAQPSLLNQILLTQNSIVEVQAENNVGFAKAGKGKVAVNPLTGKMVVLQGVARASYERKGAGVIIHPAGVIVTNAHIISQANRIAVTLADHSTISAQVVRMNPDVDIALLRVLTSDALPYVALANSDQIQLGEEIMTSGNSPLLTSTVTGGKVIGIGINRNIQKSGHQQTDLIQTTVNLYEGDSGGPLFNRRGELVGLMTAKETTADHSSFAIPANKIAIILQDYLKQVQAEKQ